MPAMAPSTAVTDSMRAGYDMVKGYITAAADQVPENLYSYQPTEEVRTLGQLFAHVADANYMFCGAARTDNVVGPDVSIEEAASGKAEIQANLAESFAYCDSAFSAVDDVTGAAAATIEAMGMTSTRLGVLALNTAHDFEHYGNIVTYMRMNDMVPPSTQMQQQQMQAASDSMDGM